MTCRSARRAIVTRLVPKEAAAILDEGIALAVQWHVANLRHAERQHDFHYAPAWPEIEAHGGVPFWDGRITDYPADVEGPAA